MATSIFNTNSQCVANSKRKLFITHVESHLFFNYTVAAVAFCFLLKHFFIVRNFFLCVCIAIIKAA
jgi:hypothetical protein